MTGATTVGVLGGGQLGRMLALAGLPLGLRFRFLDPSPDAPMRHLATQITGAYDDRDALAKLVDSVDVLTYEFENVPVAVAEQLARTHLVFPPARALAVAQDRLVEKQFFRSLAIESPPFAAVDDRASLTAAVRQIGLPAVLKTRRLGYDGKGQVVLRSDAELDGAWQALGGAHLILEGFVPFRHELSILAVRSRDGAVATYPLVENHHRDGVLRLSLAPAPDSAHLQAQAEAIATQALNALSYVGVLAIELFEMDGRLLVNEMAPRVHNSGHWTIEGAQTSQFANHIRAIMGWPLGSTEARGCAAMVNLVGIIPPMIDVLNIQGAYLHLYDKEPRPNRKVGHVTLLRDSAEELKHAVARVQALIGEQHLTSPGDL
ncbi:MAG: 5-(carboxyamino)imidazole ribonucleotide synthase [Chloroflexi bacterium]|nr:5-(carboxyamino)imidazole ribonucleotide synthase [Chloroflexota bacterium]